MAKRNFQSRPLIFRQVSNYRAVNAFTESQKLVKLYDKPADPRGLVTRQVRWQIDPGLEMLYAEETRSACCFLQVFGDNVDDVNDITEALRIRFSPLTHDDLLDDTGVSKTADERAHAVVRAGLGAPREFDDRFYAQIRNAMESTESKIREAGVWAASFLFWQEFQPPLERIESGDPEQDIRRAAKAILDFGYRKAQS